ncbi:MAG: sec-independent protein translocase protein TatB [Gammaproteobacteria bacterium]|nr:MAG: sec-independent protein translocase protein TatB [Gammaproteobacteria bacterium]TND06266.1 MAG: sec-independent protein translocase protein TatB [Gammaproteobacteria bacterium]
MFDIGFGELVVVAVVALLVIGPERLPGMVREAGSWLRRARSVAASLRDDFEREINRSEELKNLIERETRIAELHKQIDETLTSVPAGKRAPGGAQVPPADAPAPAVPAGKGPEPTTTSPHDAPPR